MVKIKIKKLNLGIGYPCENITLKATTNRTLKLSNLSEEKIKEKFKANLEDLKRILFWNKEKGFRLFRIGQGLIPFASHELFPYDWEKEHKEEINNVGILAKKLNQRLSMHPGQYVNPGSPNPKVVERSLKELYYSAKILEFLEAKDGVLIIHLGGVYGNKEKSIKRFINNLKKEKLILKFLALENDEKFWNVTEVLRVAEILGVRVIVDTLHHSLNPGNLKLEEAFELAFATWSNIPKIHLSSQDNNKKFGGHSQKIKIKDFQRVVNALIDIQWEKPLDIMIEAKSKEKAALKIIKILNFNSNNLKLRS